MFRFSKVQEEIVFFLRCHQCREAMKLFLIRLPAGCDFLFCFLLLWLDSSGFFQGRCVVVVVVVVVGGVSAVELACHRKGAYFAITVGRVVAFLHGLLPS